MNPKLAMCNFIADCRNSGNLRLSMNFQELTGLLTSMIFQVHPRRNRRWIKALSLLSPLEVRYHCPFSRQDLGHEDPDKARAADALSSDRPPGGQSGWKIPLPCTSVSVTIRPGPFPGKKPLPTCVAWCVTGRIGRSVCVWKIWPGAGAANPISLKRWSAAAVPVLTLRFGHSQACNRSRITIMNSRISSLRTLKGSKCPRLRHGSVRCRGICRLTMSNRSKYRLDSLMRIECSWWVLELREKKGLRQAKKRRG